jgi:hypothetical protein
MTAKGLFIGAPRSGSGKTSVTIGLMRALKRRGLTVKGAKSGPDYIDPGFHEAATGLPGVNLDSWAMAPALVSFLLKQSAAEADMLIVESAMGLFDGVRTAEGRTGAAAAHRRACARLLRRQQARACRSRRQARTRGFLGRREAWPRRDTRHRVLGSTAATRPRGCRPLGAPWRHPQ